MKISADILLSPFRIETDQKGLISVKGGGRDIFQLYLLKCLRPSREVL